MHVCNLDLEISDRMFIVLIKDYMYDDFGNIIAGEVREFVRGSPMTFGIIVDKAGRIGYDYDSGKRVYICLDIVTGKQIGRAHV